jgi:hypothetical protein
MRLPTSKSVSSWVGHGVLGLYPGRPEADVKDAGPELGGREES